MHGRTCGAKFADDRATAPVYCRRTISREENVVAWRVPATNGSCESEKSGQKKDFKNNGRTNKIMCPGMYAIILSSRPGDASVMKRAHETVAVTR